MTNARQHTVISVLIVLGLFVCLIAAQRSYDTRTPLRGDIPPGSLPVSVLRASDLGLHSALASLLWLNVIQNVVVYLGNSSTGMVQNLQTITELDPNFAYPYAFAVLILPGFDQSQTKAAVEIASKGVERGVPDWRIPYYLGFTYFFYLHDNNNAIKYMQATANTSGVPDNIKVVALNYGTSKTKADQTKEFWQSIHDSATDDVVRQNAQDNLDHITIIEILKSSIEIYKKTHGSYPKTLNSLVTAGILPMIPEDPFGITYGTDGGGSLSYSLGK